MAGLLPATSRSSPWSTPQCSGETRRWQPRTAACSSTVAVARSTATVRCLLPPANWRLPASPMRVHSIKPQRGWPPACAQPGRDATAAGDMCSSAEADEDCDQDINGQLAELYADVRERQAAMEAAVEAEDYGAAAAQRDAVDALMLRRRQLEILASVEARKVRFRPGQIMLHKRYEYRGVIVGMDAVCQADERWQRAMGIHRLPHGAQQPFYHVLVDERDRPGTHTTYVAQENILTVEGDRAKEISHAQIKRAFQAFENGSYVARPELQESYRQSLEAAQQNTV